MVSIQFAEHDLSQGSLSAALSRVLEACRLDKDDLLSGLSVCYEAMVKEELLPKSELPNVASWRAELEKILD